MGKQQRKSALQDSPIKKLRGRMKLNQRDFALLMAKSQAFCSDLEAGTVPLPEDMVKKLEELGVEGAVLREDYEAFSSKRLEAIKQSAMKALKEGNRKDELDETGLIC